MRPKVICHIMSSVDGRLLPGRWTAPFDGTDSAVLFKEYATLGRQLDTDAWMFGKATTREMFPYKFMPKTSEHPAPGIVNVGNRDSERLFITVDPDADIFFTSDKLRGDNIVTILGTNATDDYLEMLRQKGISFIVMPDPADLAAVMKVLGDRFGIKTVSLQGGGIINGAMLAAGLIDELSLVVYPGIDGNSASPSIFEYVGSPSVSPAGDQSLQFLSAMPAAHGIVWLRYKIHHG